MSMNQLITGYSFEIYVKTSAKLNRSTWFNHRLVMNGTNVTQSLQWLMFAMNVYKSKHTNHQHNRHSWCSSHLIASCKYPTSVRTLRHQLRRCCCAERSNTQNARMCGVSVCVLTLWTRSACTHYTQMRTHKWCVLSFGFLDVWFAANSHSHECML